MARILTGIRTDLELAVRNDQTGEAMIVALDEPNASTVPWRITVHAQMPEGRRRIGDFVTSPPAGLGDSGSRYVCSCYCPGVLHWFVSAASAVENVPANQQGELGVSASKCCGAGSLPGLTVFDRNGAPLGTAAGKSSNSGAAMVASMIFKAAPGRLFQLDGFNDSVGVVYAMYFDSPGVPINGTVPIDSIRLFPGSQFFTQGPGVETLLTGLTAAFSTTPGALTLSPAVGWLRAQWE